MIIMIMITMTTIMAIIITMMCSGCGHFSWLVSAGGPSHDLSPAATLQSMRCHAIHYNIRSAQCTIHPIHHNPLFKKFQHNALHCRVPKLVHTFPSPVERFVRLFFTLQPSPHLLPWSPHAPLPPLHHFSNQQRHQISISHWIRKENCPPSWMIGRTRPILSD